MGRTGRRPVIATPLALALAVVAGLAGCGDDDAVDLGSCATVAPTDGVTRLSVTGENLAFDEECFRIEPGPVEFTFVNADSGVSHNLHVSGPGDVNESTSLERGETTQTLELDLTEPGTYDFKCDPHPTMKGHLVVAEAS